MNIEINRAYIFILIIILCLSNALAKPVLLSIIEIGPLNALYNLYGINAVIWLSAGLTLLYLRKGAYDPLHKYDLVFSITIILTLFIPSATFAWLSLGAFSLWVLLSANSLKLKCCSSIMLLLSVRDPLLFNLSNIFNREILFIDTYLALSMHSVFDNSLYQKGNIILGNEGIKLVIMKGCSSLTNISYAILIWYTITKIYSSISKRSLYALILILFGLIGSNTTRLSLMAESLQTYNLLHSEVSNSILSILTLSFIILVSFWGARCLKTRY